MKKPYNPLASIRAAHLDDPVASRVFTDRDCARYSPEDLSLHLFDEPCWNRIQAGPAKRIYERSPGRDANNLRRYFDEVMAEDPSGELNTTVLDQLSGLDPDGRTARYRPVIYSEADLDRPAGFAALEVCLPPVDELDENEDTLLIVVECELIYVIPAQRGMGFGVTLAKYLAAGICDQLESLARQGTGGQLTLLPIIMGDWESDEGARVFRTVFEEIEYWVEVHKDEIYDRAGVRVETPKADAGY